MWRIISAGRLIRGGAAARSNYPDEIVSLFDENASRPENQTAMFNYYRALLRGGGFNRQRKLGFPKIEVPTLMLWGEKDIALSMKTTQGTEEHVEDYTIRYFEGISHHIQQDAPDEVNAMIGAFLANEAIPEYLDLKD
jgi:pimeloyl-ACP methyl ester carboxylesterase